MSQSVWLPSEREERPVWRKLRLPSTASHQVQACYVTLGSSLSQRSLRFKACLITRLLLAAPISIVRSHGGVAHHGSPLTEHACEIQESAGLWEKAVELQKSSDGPRVKAALWKGRPSQSLVSILPPSSTALKMRSLAVLLSLSSVALASWTKNLNYRSPSEHHPGMGISLHKVNKRNDPSTAFTPSQLNFTHGVASGDPYSDSVILWTRVAPISLNGSNVDSNSTVSGYVPLYNHGPKQVSTAPVCVQFKVAKTSDFAEVESSGTAYTSSDIDYTVKVSLS